MIFHEAFKCEGYG